jgi:small subunit ribosomal protein S17
VVVRVERRFTHPIYKKTVRRSKKYHAHDENNEFKPGDMVWIEESKPISKLKRWTVVRGEQKKTPEASAASEREAQLAHQKEDEVHHDSDADQPRRGRQFRRTPCHVHQGAGRLQAPLCHRRRRHRRVDQGSDPARPREEGRRDEGRRGAHRKDIRRADGSVIRFDRNAAVLINNRKSRSAPASSGRCRASCAPRTT